MAMELSPIKSKCSTVSRIPKMHRRSSSMICILPAQQLIIVDERIDFGKFAGTSYFIVQGSLESKLTIWTDGKAQPGRNTDM